MSKLFGRAWKLTVGTLDLSALDFSFTVKKTLKPLPNTCEITIYNLSDDSRGKLSNAKALPVQLEAGYKDNTSILYLGEVRNGVTTTDGVTWKSTLETGDSETALRKGRINIPVGKGLKIDDVFKRVAEAIGVKPGNLSQALSKIKSKGVANFFGAGSVISGNAAKELGALCKGIGLEFSVQDGALQILDLGASTSDSAVLLSSSTGMIGSPSVDHKGILQAQCLLIPELTPGRKVSVESATVTGGFRIDEVEYKGDTRGQDWTATIHGSKY